MKKFLIFLLITSIALFLLLLNPEKLKNSFYKRVSRFSFFSYEKLNFKNIYPISPQNFSERFPEEYKYITKSSEIQAPRFCFDKINKNITEVESLYFPQNFIIKLKNGKLISSNEYYFSSRDSFYISGSGIAFGNINNINMLDFSLKEIKGFENSTILNLSFGANEKNYFHWMTDIIPKIEMAFKSGVNIQNIAFSKNPTERFQNDSLCHLLKTYSISPKFLTLDDKFYTNAANLIEAQAVSSGEFFTSKKIITPPWVIQFLRDKFLITDQSSQSEYIYISRGDSRVGRNITNEKEIVELLTSKGFKCVTLSALSVFEQAKLFNSAKVVVAPHGAGLTNLVFCNKNTRILEIHSPYMRNVTHAFWYISCVNDLVHLNLLGDTVDNISQHKNIEVNNYSQDYRVDIFKLENMLHEICSYKE